MCIFEHITKNKSNKIKTKKKGERKETGSSDKSIYQKQLKLNSNETESEAIQIG